MKAKKSREDKNSSQFLQVIFEAYFQIKGTSEWGFLTNKR